jgi:hypothetical protein
MTGDQWFAVGTLMLAVVNTAILAVHAISDRKFHSLMEADQKTQWEAIEGMREQRVSALALFETKENADRRSTEVWSGIDKLRESVAELSTLAAQNYVRREELREMVRDIKGDLLRQSGEIASALKKMVEVRA